MTKIRTYKMRAVYSLFLFIGWAAFGCVGQTIVAELLPEGEKETDLDNLPNDSDADWWTGDEDSDSSGEEKILEGCGDSDGLWADRVYIDYAPELAALTANNRKVTRIAGDLIIDGVEGDHLSLEELASLRCVDGSLIITDVPGLTDLNNLSELHTVGGYVLIEGNTALPNCKAIDLYNQLSIPSDWDSICINDNLEDGCTGISTGCSYSSLW
jgi:hypothetical protein